MLTGSARLSQEAREKAEALARQEEAERRNRERKRKREALEARIAALRKEFEAEEEEAATLDAAGIGARKHSWRRTQRHGSQPPG